MYICFLYFDKSVCLLGGNDGRQNCENDDFVSVISVKSGLLKMCVLNMSLTSHEQI